MVDTVKSTSDVILESLQHDILLGILPGGAQLKQNTIAADFNVSASTVREALQRLVASGLAIASTNRGVSVTPMSERDFTDIAELRLLLEPQAIRLSAPNLTADDLDDAEKLLHLAADSTSAVVQSQLHWRFHLMLYGKADRPRLLSNIEALYIGLARYVCPVWDKIGLSPDWVDMHMEISNAVRKSDFARAEKLTIDQLRGGATRWKEQVEIIESGGTSRARNNIACSGTVSKRKFK